MRTPSESAEDFSRINLWARDPVGLVELFSFVLFLLIPPLFAEREFSKSSPAIAHTARDTTVTTTTEPTTRQAKAFLLVLHIASSEHKTSCLQLDRGRTGFTRWRIVGLLSISRGTSRCSANGRGCRDCCEKALLGSVREIKRQYR